MAFQIHIFWLLSVRRYYSVNILLRKNSAQISIYVTSLLNEWVENKVFWLSFPSKFERTPRGNQNFFRRLLCVLRFELLNLLRISLQYNIIGRIWPSYPLQTFNWTNFLIPSRSSTHGGFLCSLVRITSILKFGSFVEQLVSFLD